MGEQKEMQYRGYYAKYRYDETLEIWYGKTRIRFLADTGAVPKTRNSISQEQEIAFASMSRVNLEEQFHAIVDKALNLKT